MSKSSRARRNATLASSEPDELLNLVSDTLPLTYERKRWATGASHLLIGVDEAGRGPLAGPVVAAACSILRGTASSPPPVLGVDDSKKITDEATREQLYAALVAHPNVVYGVSCIDHQVIDRINILQAAMFAMELAVADLQRKLGARDSAVLVLVDGPRVPARLTEAVGSETPIVLPEPASLGSLPHLEDGVTVAAGAMPRPASVQLLSIDDAQPLVQGDAKCYSIAAASIIAKVTRDRHMHALAASYPACGFDVHKGYGVPAHMAAIHEHGPCAIHRRTFAPVKHMAPPVVSASSKKRSRGARDEEHKEQAVVSIRGSRDAPAASAKKAKLVAAPAAETAVGVAPAARRRSARLHPE